jgi:hypothetical protein
MSRIQFFGSRDLIQSRRQQGAGVVSDVEMSASTVAHYIRCMSIPSIVNQLISVVNALITLLATSDGQG